MNAIMAAAHGSAQQGTARHRPRLRDKQSRGKETVNTKGKGLEVCRGFSRFQSREAPSPPNSRFILPLPSHDNPFSSSHWHCCRHGYQRNAALKKLAFPLPQLSHLLPLFPLSHQHTLPSTKEVSQCSVFVWQGPDTDSPHTLAACQKAQLLHNAPRSISKEQKFLSNLEPQLYIRH